LRLGFVTDLRPAEHQRDRGDNLLEHPHHFERLPGVPDVDAQADDRGSRRQDLLDDLQGALVDVELHDLRLWGEFPHIGHQAA